MTAPRLLVYVQHLLGVGHVKRAAAISRACRQAGMEVHVALGGERVPHVDFGGAELVELPAIRSLDMTFKTLVTAADGRPVDETVWFERRNILSSAAAEFEPDALLVEHFPFGRRQFAGEIVPLIEEMRSAGRPVIGSVRDVLVEKRDATKSQRSAAVARAAFDRILVHGDPDVVAFERTFPAAKDIADLIRYTGYIVDDVAGIAAPGREGEGEVIVSTGGGAVGARLLSAAAEAAGAGALAPRTWRLLAGANMPDADFARLRASSSPLLIVERARPDFRSLLSRSALSISQAGYNTMMDILVARCPALVVPFAGAEESEQSLRAREFERRGVLSVLDEKELSPATLARAAAVALQKGLRGQPPSIDLDGARRSATIIIETIDDRRRRRRS